MNADRQVAVSLEPTTYPLTLTLTGAGTGAVTWSGGSCTSSCSPSFANDAKVTLTAAAGPGSLFLGWAGACSGTAATCTVTMNGARSVAARFETATKRLTVASSGGGGGTVTGGGLGPCVITAGTAGSGCTADVPYGASVTLTATPDATSQFQGWASTCSGTAPCTFTMTADRQVVVSLEPLSQPLTLDFTGAGTGTVSWSGGSCTSSCSPSFPNDTVVTVTAAAGPGSLFLGWSGSCSGTAATCTVTMNAARSVTARFETASKRLTVVPTGGGGGTVSGGGLGPCVITAGTGGAGCAVDVPYGDSVTLTAVPDASSLFQGWGSTCTGTGPCTFTMTANQQVIVSLEPTTYPLSLTFAGPGTGTVSWSAGSCTSSCSPALANGATVTLTAAAGSGSLFLGWSGSCGGTSATCTVTMDAARSVTARFETSTKRLTVLPLGGGGGTVAGGGLGPCVIIAGAAGSGCTADVPYGASVTLTASADGSSVFQGWGSTCTGTGPCTFEMSADRQVAASFEPSTYPLTLTFSGPGSGTVTWSGGSCTSSCSPTIQNGTVVTLTAAAGSGSSFLGWSGSCSGTAPTCTVTMNAARSVTARFETATKRLTIVPTGGGGGTISGGGLGPCVITAGVAGSGCAADVPYGASVTLTATPDGSSLFQGWASTCTGTGPCTFSMTADRQVVASLEPSTYPLDLTFIGPGTGTVSWSGGSCTSSCSPSLPNGATVTLTATAGSGSLFLGWSGSCSGTGATCTVTVTAARQVTARFETATKRLTIVPTGGGGGTVSGGGLGPCVINGGVAGSGCTADVPYGASVTLTASADASSLFQGWASACTGTGPCTFTMNADRQVAVLLEPSTYPLTLAFTGVGAGTVSWPGGNCTSGCSPSFANGATVTLTASAGSGSLFLGWFGSCSGTASTCTVTMSAPRTVTAWFETSTKRLTVVPTGTGGGTVSGGGLGPCAITAGTADAGCAVDVPYGGSVTLTAAPDPTSVFEGWTTPCTGTGPCTFSMTADRSASARFVPAP
jgi:hypothetical protein